jgi:hypothetical protein
MATKPPSPAQLAARERFAEMARSGSLNRKRQIAAKKRAANPISDLGTYGPFFGDPDAPMTESQIERRAESYMDRLDRQFTRGDITEAQYNREVKALNKYVKELYAKNKRKRNPANPGLYDNINAKRARIAAGSGERMRRPGTKGAPTEEAFKRSAKTARKSNPQTKSVKSTSTANFKYCVEAKRSLGSAGSVFEMVAGFNTKAQAQNYIDAILASNPGVTLRIKTYK